MTWNTDITKAPTDTRVLVWGAKRLEWAVAMYTDKDGWQVETCSDWIPIHVPKAWLPLPPPPSRTGAPHE